MHNIKFAVFYYYFYLRSFLAGPEPIARRRRMRGTDSLSAYTQLSSAQLTFIGFSSPRPTTPRFRSGDDVVPVYHYGSAGGLEGNRVINDPDKGLGL